MDNTKDIGMDVHKEALATAALNGAGKPYSEDDLKRVQTYVLEASRN